MPVEGTQRALLGAEVQDGKDYAAEDVMEDSPGPEEVGEVARDHARVVPKDAAAPRSEHQRPVPFAVGKAQHLLGPAAHRRLDLRLLLVADGPGVDGRRGDE